MPIPHKPFLISVCIFVVSILLIEISMLAIFRRADLSPISTELKYLQEVVTSSQEYDVLFLGDSTARNGFIPETFDTLSGGNSYNLGVVAIVSPLSDAYFIEAYLKHHPAPKAFVISRSALQWFDTPPQALFQDQLPSIPMARALYRDGHLSFENTLRVALARILPTFRYRRYVKRSFLEGLHALFIPPAENPNYSITTRRKANGYLRSNGIVTEANVQNTLEKVHKWRESGNKITAPESVTLLRHACKTAFRHNVIVFAGVSPYTAELDTDPIAKGFREEVQSTLTDVIKSEPGCVRLSNEDEIVYGNEFLSDSTHLNHTGAILYTTYVAEKVSQLIYSTAP